MEPPPRGTKRPRVDDSDSSAAAPWIADSQVWFDDGNIIIVAGEVAFRVYKGTLARSSEVFQHLFSLPTPDSDADRTDLEQADGVPVVHLPDSHVDLKHLFLALYCNKK